TLVSPVGNDSPDLSGEVVYVELTEQNHIPSWYEAEDLKVLTFSVDADGAEKTDATGGTYSSAIHGKSTNVSLCVDKGLASSPDAPKSESANFIKLKIPTSPEEAHFGCSNLYYNMKEERVICFDCLCEKAAKQAGVLPERQFIGELKCVDPLTGGCIFALTHGGDWTASTASYAYNIYTEELTLLPIEVTKQYKFYPTSDLKTIAMPLSYSDPESKHTFLLIKAEGGVSYKKSVTVRGEDTYEIATSGYSYTPDEKYLILPTRVFPVDTRYPDARAGGFVAFFLKDETYCYIPGKLLHYLPDEQGFVTLDREGLHFYEANTAKQNDEVLARLASWQTKDLGIYQSEEHNRSSQREHLLLAASTPTEEGAATEIYAENMDAILIADRYIYTYRHLEDFITCIDVETEEFFRLQLNGEFVRDIRNLSEPTLSSDGRYVHETELAYKLTLSSDKSCLCLNYTETHTGHLFSDEEPDTTDYVTEDEVKQLFRACDSLTDFAELFCGKVPASETQDVREFQVCYGDGFTSVYLPVMRSYPTYLIEDYERRTLGIYQVFDFESDDRSLHTAQYSVLYPPSEPYPTLNSAAYLKPLSENAEQEETKETLSFLPTAEDHLHLSRYYTDGELKNTALARRDYFETYLKKKTA
ncbi:MAG: hypothetical protein J6J21_04330, partial [Clostridia bacterium]|nr:hypothetical protein [Clostridia bacterium]